MKIENISRRATELGTHRLVAAESMLIQIGDPGGEVPTPPDEFKEAHVFYFLDAEDEDDFPDEAKITPHQASQIVALLHSAKTRNMNVVVHCTMGLCRSGAIVEFAKELGFQPVHDLRMPNLRVKRMLWEESGWTGSAFGEIER